MTAKDVILARAASSQASRLPTLTAWISGLRPGKAYGNAVPLLTDDYAPVDSLLRE
jgi:hypothetical protein